MGWVAFVVIGWLIYAGCNHRDGNRLGFLSLELVYRANSGAIRKEPFEQVYLHVIWRHYHDVLEGYEML